MLKMFTQYECGIYTWLHRQTTGKEIQCLTSALRCSTVDLYDTQLFDKQDGLRFVSEISH